MYEICFLNIFTPIKYDFCKKLHIGDTEQNTNFSEKCCTLRGCTFGAPGVFAKMIIYYCFFVKKKKKIIINSRYYSCIQYKWSLQTQFWEKNKIAWFTSSCWHSLSSITWLANILNREFCWSLLANQASKQKEGQQEEANQAILFFLIIGFVGTIFHEYKNNLIVQSQ